MGDHVMVSLGAYQHHAIDMGDGQIIQYGGGQLNAAENQVFIASRESLEQYGPVMAVQSAAKYSPEEIVERASGRIGEQNYSLFGNNCEHFVNWCRTGRSTSRQVERIVQRMASCGAKVTQRRVARPKISN